MLFIVFEGIDGAGKTTLSKMLAEKLEGEGYTVHLTSEPGGTAIGQTIKGLLNDELNDLDPKTKWLLFMADRVENIKNNILPYVETNDIVISDRFTASTIAYQVYGHGLDKRLVHKLNKYSCEYYKDVYEHLGVVGEVYPNFTFYLDISPTTSFERKGEYDLPFLQRVRQGYQDILAANILAGDDACYQLLGTDDLQAILAKTYVCIRHKLPAPFPSEIPEPKATDDEPKPVEEDEFEFIVDTLSPREAYEMGVKAASQIPETFLAFLGDISQNIADRVNEAIDTRFKIHEGEKDGEKSHETK